MKPAVRFGFPPDEKTAYRISEEKPIFAEIFNDDTDPVFFSQPDDGPCAGGFPQNCALNGKNI